MDVIRGSAVLLIIGFHATTISDTYGDLPAPQWLTDANTVITPLRIPLLVLLSGMLLDSSLRKGSRRYFAGKGRNVAWPYLVWTLIWGAASWPVYSVVGYLLGGSYLWFLLFLLSFYGAAWLLRALPPAAVVLLAVTASAAASFLTLGASTYGERWPYLFAVFMLGHLLTVRPAVRTWTYTSPWAYFLLAVLLTVHFGLSLGYDYGLESSLFMLTGAILAIRLALRIGSARVLRPVRFVGRNSLVFYVSHYPLMVAVVIAVSATTGITGSHTLLLVLGLTAAAVTAGTAAVLINDRLPATRWLFTVPTRGPTPVQSRHPGGWSTT